MKNLIKSFAVFIWIINLSHLSCASQLSELDALDKRIQEIYQLINTHWTYPAIGFNDIDTMPSWPKAEVQTNRGDMLALVWDYKKTPSFSQALDEIIQADIKMECMNAARIVRLALIHSVLGDDKMLMLAQKLSKNCTPFQVMHHLSWQFFNQRPDDKEPGIYAYGFVNIPEYSSLKAGYADNHNIIKLSYGEYMGFAPEFFRSSQTYQTFSRFMFDKVISQKDIIPGKEKVHTEFCQELTFEDFEQKRISRQKQLGYYIFDFQITQNYRFDLK